MSTVKPKVHSVKGKTVIKRYRLIPYDELCKVLSEEGEAFVEGPFKRQTVWKAARKLSIMTGKTVRAEQAVLKLPGEREVLEGYAFVAEGSKT